MLGALVDHLQLRPSSTWSNTPGRVTGILTPVIMRAVADFGVCEGQLKLCKRDARVVEGAKAGSFAV